MNLTEYVYATLRRWLGPIPTPVFSWWPDWVRRSRDELRALAISAVKSRRTRASRMQLRRELERLDDRLLLDIGIQPSTLRRAQRINPGRWLPNPWR